MAPIRVGVALVAAVLLLAGCGGDGDTSTPGTPATTSATTAAFELSAWRETWEPAQSAYGDALGVFGSDVAYLLDNGATNAQIAAAISRLSADVETSGRSLIAAMDRADPLPEDRADVASATQALRAAVAAQVEAYAALADCGTSYGCQKKEFAATDAASADVEAALQAYPEQ
jgi:hypothetical protein